MADNALDQERGAASAQVLRLVRMVLLEYLHGCTMHSLMFGEKGRYMESVREKYHESYRLNVWAKYLEAHSLFTDARMRNEDDAPRNVMPVHRPEENLLLSAQPAPRVVLIDFNFAVVFDRVRREGEDPPPPPEADLPDNPLQRWFGSSSHDYKGWLPEWYEENDKRCSEWLIEQFGRGNAKRWRPLYKEFRFDPDSMML